MVFFYGFYLFNLINLVYNQILSIKIVYNHKVRLLDELSDLLNSLDKKSES